MTKLKIASSETFRSLSNRNFRLFFAGQSISQIGNWLTLVAQTLLVFKLTHSGVTLGLLAAAQFGPVLLFGGYAGLVADRSDKRKLLLIVQSLAMVQSFALGSIAFMHKPPVWGIFLIAIAGGIATAFDNPARRSFVVEMVETEDINNAVSLNSALMTGSRIFGPALAGVLITTVGFGWAFWLDGISYVAVLVGLAKMNPAELHPAPPAVRGRGQISAGIKYARSIPELWVPLVMMTIIGTLAFNFQTVLPVFVRRDLHGGTLTFTLLFSVVSSGSLVGALITARRRVVGLKHVTFAALGFGVSMVLLALSPNTAIAFIVGVTLGLTSITFMTSSTAIVQTRSDPSMRGRILALQSIVFLGSTPIGGPIVGTISQNFGARYALGLGAIGCVAAGVIGLSQQRARDREVVANAPVLEGGAV
jgi:MFS family permease